MDLSYGLELEWADVDRRATLPPGCGEWSSADYTIVNSDGHANDPTGATWQWGGEINTKPSLTIAQQLAQVRSLRRALGPTINYRCNLHVHIGFATTHITVELARRLLAFTVEWQLKLYPLIEPIPKPRLDDFADVEAYDGAMRRYRRRHVSHQHRLPPKRVKEALAARTLDEFYEAHAPLTAAGRRAWHLAPRPGINTRSLHKHGTIEFRHFPGSADEQEISDALDWCRIYIECALYDVDPVKTFIEGRPWRFPTFRPYVHELEIGYQATRLK